MAEKMFLIMEVKILGKPDSEKLIGVSPVDRIGPEHGWFRPDRLIPASRLRYGEAIGELAFHPEYGWTTETISVREQEWLILDPPTEKRDGEWLLG